MTIRPLRNKKDLQYEKQRLLDHRKALEASLRLRWKDIRDGVKPTSLLRQVVQMVTH